MIRVLYRDPDGQLRTDVPLEQVPALKQKPGGLVWVDLLAEALHLCAGAEPPEVSEPVLRDI